MSENNAQRSTLNRVRAASLRFLAAAVAVAGLTASAWAWLAPTGIARPTAVVNRADVVVPARANLQEDEVQAIVVTVRAGRLEPSELTLPAGDYLLVVQNRSGQRDLIFRFDRETGERLHEARDPERRLDWSKRFRLTAGVYVLGEADHPELSCRINITPN
jgi:hypothetical protein